MTVALRRPHKGMKTGWCRETGNHKGCPYDRFAGAYFHSNDDIRDVPFIFISMTTWGGMTKRCRECRHNLIPFLWETST